MQLYSSYKPKYQYKQSKSKLKIKKEIFSLIQLYLIPLHEITLDMAKTKDLQMLVIMFLQLYCYAFLKLKMYDHNQLLQTKSISNFTSHCINSTTLYLINASHSRPKTYQVIYPHKLPTLPQQGRLEGRWPSRQQMPSRTLVLISCSVHTWGGKKKLLLMPDRCGYLNLETYLTIPLFRNSSL